MRRVLECIRIVGRFYFSRAHWKANWVRFLLRFVWLIGLFWLAIEFTHFFFGDDSPIPRSTAMFWICVIASLATSFLSTLPLLSAESRIDNRDIAIRLVLGSVFNQDGDIALATNTTFDTTMEGDFISPGSIQGQLAKKEYDDVSHLDADLAAQLSRETPITTLKRDKSKQERYSIGTVIKLSHRSGFKSYWVALADVNESGKPHGTFPDLQMCLENLWQFVADKGHMTRLVIPLLGSGKTGIKEPRLTILKEILFSFVAYAKERKITEELVICIHPKDVSRGKLEMTELTKYLDYLCHYRYEAGNVNSTSEGTG